MSAMQIYRDLREAHLPGPTYLTIGNFDGIHLGHQALLRTLLEQARQDPSGRALSALLTFDPHPVTVLRPGTEHAILTTPEERMELAGALGVQVGIIQPFTLELAQLEAREFVGLLKRHLGLAGLVTGPDFALGKGRSGTLDVLRALGQEMGFRVTVVQPVTVTGEDGQPHEVRSFHIRQLLRQGDVTSATRMLGRHYRVPGRVVAGDRRGRAIGVPTANLEPIPPQRLLPGDGVYATRTWLGKPEASPVFPSVTNIGVRPTVDGRRRVVETHLLDFPPPGESGDLYGRVVTVEFLARLRGEQRFPDLAALVAQIQEDIRQARSILAAQAAGTPEDSAE